MEQAIQHGADIIIRDWVRLRAGERILIVSSQKYAVEVAAMQQAAQAVGSVADVLMLDDLHEQVGQYFDTKPSLCRGECPLRGQDVRGAGAMTYDSVVQATRKKFLNADVSSVSGTLAFQINLIGKVEGIFYIEIKDGQVHVEPYEYYDRNAILTVNATNFTKLINGKLDPVIAFTTGKLKVDGDVNAALELIKFIK